MKVQVRLLAKKLQETQKASDSALSIVMESDPRKTQARIAEIEKKVEESRGSGFFAKLLNNNSKELEVSLAKARRDLVREQQVEVRFQVDCSLVALLTEV